MTGRVFGWLGIKNGVGFAPGGDRGRGVEPKRRRDGDRPPRRSWRHRGSGLDPGAGQAACGSGPTGNRHSPEPGPCRPTAGMPDLRSRVPGQGLPPPPDRHPVRQVTLRLPRFRCAGCGGTEAGHRAGRRIAARRPSSTRSGRSFPPACRTGSLPACSNTFCRSMPGSTPRPCAPARSRSARNCGTPLRLNRQRRPRRSP